jgi:hypothetical protein
MLILDTSDVAYGLVRSQPLRKPLEFELLVSCDDASRSHDQLDPLYSHRQGLIVAGTNGQTLTGRF